MAKILKGAPVAERICEELRPRVLFLKERGVVPCLAIVRMGENAGDLAYESAAKRRCDSLGLQLLVFVLPENAANEELLSVIDGINKDDSIHACLIMRPFPPHINEDEVCEFLNIHKDVDCVTSYSLSRVFSGYGQGFFPCTAESCMAILDHYGYELSGARVAVIGRSLVIGRPVSIMLQDRDATVTMCHTKTKNLPKVCRNKDILIVAAGCAGVIDESFVNENQIVIDVGINGDENGNIVGDVNFAAVENHVSAITPVPGGVGSVTASILAKHVIEAAERQTKR